MDLPLIGRDRYFFPVDSILDVDCCLILLAIVRSSIDRLLNCKEISASILRYDEIIINDMRCQFRDYLDDFRKKKIYNLPRSGHIGVGIILKSFRMFRIYSLFNPHIVSACRLISQTDEPLLRDFICINQREVVLLGNLLYSCRVIPMTFPLEISFRIKPSARDWSKEHRLRSDTQCMINEHSEIGLIVTEWCSIACRVGLF